jgi:hypothetical protein
MVDKLDDREVFSLRRRHTSGRRHRADRGPILALHPVLTGIGKNVACWRGNLSRLGLEIGEPGAQRLGESLLKYTDVDDE